MSLLRQSLPLTVLALAACAPPEFSPIGLTLPDSVPMTEGGVQAIPIALDGIPKADITVRLTTSDDSKLKVHPSSLVFTTQNWGEAQNVTLSAVEDHVAAESAAVNVEFELTSGNSTNEPLLESFRVDIEDNDTADVQVDAAANLETHELGGTATFTIALTSRPFAAVTIPVSSTDSTEGTVSPTAVVIEPDDWQTPHVVTVTGVAEAGLDHDVEYTVTTGAAVSTDETYRGRDPADVSLINRDFISEEFAPPGRANNEDAPVAGVSADGELVAFVNAGQAVVWNPRTGDELRFGADVVHAALAGDGTVLAFAERSLTKSRLLIVDDLANDEGDVTFSTEPSAYIRGLSISWDGRFVAFESDASALAPDGRLGGVVVHDTVGAEPTMRIDNENINGQPIEWSGSPSISNDGDIVAFEASIRTMGGPHIVLWRKFTPLALASTSATVTTTEVTSGPVISGDGRVVVFSAHADFVLAGETTQMSAPYAYDVTNDSLEPLTAGMPPEPLFGFSPTVSVEGDVIAFESILEGTDGADTSAALLIHKRTTRETRRIDLSDAGAPLTGRCSAVAPPSSFLAFLCEDGESEITLHFVEIGDAFWQSKTP